MPPKPAPKSKVKIKPKVQPPSFCNPQAVVTIYIATPKPESSGGSRITDDLSRTHFTTHPTMNPKTSKFMIHKDLICYRSPFFKAAFDGNFLKGKTQEMTLEADVVAFGIVVSWFYTKKLVNSDGKTPDLVTLAQSWILAEHFKMPKLQNQIMVGIHVTFVNGGYKGRK